MKVDVLIAFPLVAAALYALLGRTAVVAFGFLAVLWRVSPFRAIPLMGGGESSNLVYDMLRKARVHGPIIPPREGSILLGLTMG